MQMHVFTKREEVDTAEAIIEKKETRLAQIRYSSVLSTITSSYTTRQYTQAFTQGLQWCQLVTFVKNK